MAHLDPDRINCLTGSEMASILGENPFPDQGPLDVMFKKKFHVFFEGNEATKHGQKYEPVALRKFLDRSGAKLEPSSYERSSDYPWISGTVDALVTTVDGRRAVVEIKCPLHRPIPKDGQQKYPQYYYAQMQTYMQLTDREVCLFVQYKPEMPTPKGRKMKPEQLDVCEVPRDRAYIYERLPRLKRFWDELFVWRRSVERFQLEFSLRLLVAAFRARKTPPGSALRVAARGLAGQHYAARACARFAALTCAPPYQTVRYLRDVLADPRPPYKLISDVDTPPCGCPSCSLLYARMHRQPCPRRR